jgi:hypothetical protein
MSDPVDFLCAIYCNDELPLSVRMRAAIEAAPYLHPKLNAIAVGNMSGNDIATLLDRAIARSNAVMKIIEHDANAAHNGDGHHTQEVQESFSSDAKAEVAPATQSPSEISAQALRQPFPRLRR